MDMAPAELLVSNDGGWEQMHAVVLLTQAMYSAAQAREWSVFTELESQRAEALARLLPLSLPSGEQGAEVARHMQELLALNHHMIELAEQEKNGVELELRHFREAQQAQQAYTRNL